MRVGVAVPRLARRIVIVTLVRMAGLARVIVVVTLVGHAFSSP
jgi:hypothetical protein